MFPFIYLHSCRYICWIFSFCVQCNASGHPRFKGTQCHCQYNWLPTTNTSRGFLSSHSGRSTRSASSYIQVWEIKEFVLNRHVTGACRILLCITVNMYSTQYRNLLYFRCKKYFRTQKTYANILCEYNSIANICPTLVGSMLHTSTSRIAAAHISLHMW